MANIDTTQDNGILVKQTTARVTKTAKLGVINPPPEEKEEILEVHKFQTEPAHVALGLKMTVNLGNYESASIEVRVDKPCYSEEIEEAYKCVENWVQEKVVKEAEAVKEFARKSR